MHPPYKLKKLVVGSTAQDPRPRSLYFGADGDIDIENDDGTTQATVPVVKGGTLICQFFKVTAQNNGDEVYGLYN